MSDAQSNDPAIANGCDMAFPCEGPNTTAYGLTKRELFAAMAMESIAGQYVQGGDFMEKHIAKGAVKIADALLEELSK